MNMARNYKKTFLDHVIARVDFASELPLKDSLPDTVAREAVKRFPVSEPKKVFFGRVQIRKGGDISAKKIDVGTEWNFHGKEREKTLCITSSCMWTDYKKYESFEVLKNDFLAVLKTLFECYKEAVVIKRLGLRYINTVRLKDGDPTDWNGFFDPNLLHLPKIVKDKSKLSRAFHTVILNLGDERIKVQYGMRNPDYPATVRSREFTLDIDAFYEGLQDENEVESNLEKFHKHIKQVFEETITGKLRKEMNKNG